MSESAEPIAYCHACGSPMNVEAVAPFTNVECPRCGKHTRVKREFGPYTLLRRHAIGGMSHVFVARDNPLGREVALKILNETYCSDEKRIGRFIEEARITASFTHPNVVRVFKTGSAFGRFYIAMEMVPGGHLEHLIRERGKIPEEELVPLAIQIVRGLKAAQTAGLIHRDMKPGNILLDAKGHAKIVDFGLALMTEAGSVQATEWWATPYYVPPETVEGKPEDFRADIYALGATLYHALAGEPSCAEETMETAVLIEAKKNIKPLRRLCPELSGRICKIVTRALAFDPEDRFDSYDELIDRLEEANRKKGDRDEEDVPMKEEKSTGTWVALGMVAAVLVGIASLLVWSFLRDASAGADEQAKLSVISRVQVPPMPPVPDVAKRHNDALAALKAGENSAATGIFLGLRDDSSVSEPTATLAGVEAVIAAQLDGNAELVLAESKKSAAHAIAAQDGNPGLVETLVPILNELAKGGLPTGEITAEGARGVLAGTLTGLAHWEHGSADESAAWLMKARTIILAEPEQWAAVYQERAGLYLEDYEILKDRLKAELPSDEAACRTSIKELEEILPTLKSGVRVRFLVREKQLALAKQAKLLAPPPAEPVEKAPVEEVVPPPPEPGVILEKVTEMAGRFAFDDAINYLNTLPENPTAQALLRVTQSSQEFLADLTSRLKATPVALELRLRTDEIFTGISADSDGKLFLASANAPPRQVEWADLSQDSIISLHRFFIKGRQVNNELIDRHRGAICFDWLVGKRERAVAAADRLSQNNAAFKKQWDEISANLPD